MTDGSGEHGARAPNFLHRQQVADRLGRTISGIRSLEKRGKLHPVKRVLKINGRREPAWAFEEAEVEALAREFSVARESSTPELRDAKVIAAFREGKNVNDVVIELGIPHVLAEQMWNRFKRYEPHRGDDERFAPSDDELEAAERDAQKEHEKNFAAGLDSLSKIRAKRDADLRARARGKKSS